MAQFLDKEHPQVQFFKQDEIGLVLSKALAETYKLQPTNPVEFFAKYLLNHSKTQKKCQQGKDRERDVQELKDKNKYFQMAKKAEETEKEKDSQAEIDKIVKFYDTINKSTDLSDNLDELANFLQWQTKATGVYIGKLIKPRKAISDDDDDKAHIDEDSAKIISYIQSSKGHEFMKGRILLNTQGLTHSVFEELPPEEEKFDEDGNPIPKQVKPNDVLSTIKNVYIKEVVREQKMHFFKVPRLGSYLALPLVYQSCQFEEALDNAVADYLEVKVKQEEQQKQIQEWEDEKQREREEKERNGEVYEPEEKKWEEIVQKPFDSFPESYCICLDTMGQDREFCEADKAVIVQTVERFKQVWEETEIENLRRDLKKKLEVMQFDKEFLDNEAQKLLEEEEKHIEEMLAAKEEQQPLDEEYKDIYHRSVRLHFIGKLFHDRQDWKNNLMALKDFTVLKMPRVLQSLMYLLRYEREKLCEKDTNKFFWKIAKNHLDDEFVKRLSNYQVLGPKDSDHAKYTTINFVEKNVEGITQDEVDQYNLTLGKLFKWLVLAVKTRKDDIIRRKAQKKKAREDREAQIEASKQRELKREQDVIDAEEKFKEEHKEEIEAFIRYEQANADKSRDEYGQEQEEEDEEKEKPVMPVFNFEEHFSRWEEENPPIVISEPVVPEKDLDWQMTEDEEDAYISAYIQSKQEHSF